MRKYVKYFIYILEHKINVFKVSWNHQFFYALFHDMSKFSRIEFISYAKHFFGSDTDKNNSNFEYGWLHHQRKNKHHWDYWVNGDGIPIKIPEKYIDQIIYDWTAMSLKFNDTPIKYYLNNKDKIILHNDSRKILESKLGISI